MTTSSSSPWLEWMVGLPPEELKRHVQQLSAEQALVALYTWPNWARPNQLPPKGAWFIWLLLAGRGFGKTRAGAEWVIDEARSGRKKRFALVGATAADVRNVMVEGESGILTCSPPWFRPTYEPSKRRLSWPNGAIATIFSADSPERLRGPQHDGAWCDEIRAWQHGHNAWDNLLLGLRLGSNPQVVVTTTPRAIPMIKDMLARSVGAGADVMVTRGRTYDNLQNLAPTFRATVVRRYEGTRLGRQELEAEMLEDMPGALWNHAMIDELRVVRLPDLGRVVVAVDPAMTAGEQADETGIITAGIGSCDCKGDVEQHGFVLGDWSGRYSPNDWGAKAVSAYHQAKADRIVAEVNQGGDMVETVIRTVDRTIPYKAVRASRGKYTRAEPVAALYEQGKVHHLGQLDELEDQMCAFVPGEQRGVDGSDSPDRVDALVWALTELLLSGQSTRIWAT